MTDYVECGAVFVSSVRYSNFMVYTYVLERIEKIMRGTLHQ
jgi:hypothetical protein